MLDRVVIAESLAQRKRGQVVPPNRTEAESEIPPKPRPEIIATVFPVVAKPVDGVTDVSCGESMLQQDKDFVLGSAG
jgi:hypothetical protein